MNLIEISTFTEGMKHICIISFQYVIRYILLYMSYFQLIQLSIIHALLLRIKSKIGFIIQLTRYQSLLGCTSKSRIYRYVSDLPILKLMLSPGFVMNPLSLYFHARAELQEVSYWLLGQKHWRLITHDVCSEGPHTMQSSENHQSCLCICMQFSCTLHIKNGNSLHGASWWFLRTSVFQSLQTFRYRYKWMYYLVSMK